MVGGQGQLQCGLRNSFFTYKYFANILLVHITQLCSSTSEYTSWMSGPQVNAFLYPISSRDKEQHHRRPSKWIKGDHSFQIRMLGPQKHEEVEENPSDQPDICVCVTHNGDRWIWHSQLPLHTYITIYQDKFRSMEERGGKENWGRKSDAQCH